MSSNIGYQNKFATTLLSAVGTTDTTIYLNALPTPSEGWLTLDEGLSTEEIIYYTSKGSNFVTLPSAATGRGLGGTSAAGHSAGAVVKMKITAQHFLGFQNGTDFSSNVAGGWLPADGSWTYLSATTMTVPSSDAGKLTVGSKIQLTQTTNKYFYVTSVSGTTITLNGGSDYTLVNAGITSPYISNAVSAVGFPTWFNYSPTQVGMTSLTAQIYRFNLVGRMLTVVINAAGTGNSTAQTFTAPVNSANINANNYWTASINAIVDSGTTRSTPGRAYIANNSGSIIAGRGPNDDTWTASGSRQVSFNLQYEI